MLPHTLNTRDSAWKGQDLDRVTEASAAKVTIEFLKEVRDRAQAAVDAGTREAAQALHWVRDFSTFDALHLGFLLPTIGAGEVRIVLHEGLVKIEETGVPCLWRMQMGDQSTFVLALIPRSVVQTASKGLDRIEIPDTRPNDVFAAPAILEELNSAIEKTDTTVLQEGPAYMVELTRQPLGPGDMTYLIGTLGHGNIDIRLTGFAKSRLSSTRVRGVWRSQILNNAGKNLLDAYVVGLIPPEVPASVDELADTVDKCNELIDWIESDIDRGAIG